MKTIRWEKQLKKEGIKNFVMEAAVWPTSHCIHFGPYIFICKYWLPIVIGLVRDPWSTTHIWCWTHMGTPGHPAGAAEVGFYSSQFLFGSVLHCFSQKSSQFQEGECISDFHLIYTQLSWIFKINSTILINN